MPTATNLVDAEYTVLLASFRRALLAQNKAAATVTAYTRAARDLGAFLADRGMPTHPGNITREHVETFILDQVQRRKPETAASRYRWLQQWFRFLVEEGEIASSPMARMRQPHIPEHPPPVLRDEAVRALLAVCEGRTFYQRRDMAVLRLLLDTGMRRAECAGLQLVDLDLDLNVARVLGKGRRERACPFGRKTALALDRYLRVRAQHKYSYLSELWVGHMGPLHGEALEDLVKRRAAKAGLGRVYPHLFRHKWAHQVLASGMQENDVRLLAGWRGSAMIARYGASAAAERAREAYRERSPGDRF